MKRSYLVAFLSLYVAAFWGGVSALPKMPAYFDNKPKSRLMSRAEMNKQHVQKRARVKHIKKKMNAAKQRSSKKGKGSGALPAVPRWGKR